MNGPRVLVIRRRYLGDTVLMEPFFRNLRSHWPSAHLTAVVDTPYLDALANSPDMDEILETPVRGVGLGRNFRRWGRLVLTVARRTYDLCFDFARNERAQILALLSRAPVRVSYEVAGQRLHRKHIYTHVLEMAREEDARTHTVDRNNRLLELVGVPAPHRVPHLAIRKTDRETAARLLTEAQMSARTSSGISTTDLSRGPLVLVHPGSGAEARRWPPERFAAVADHMIRVHGARVVVVSGPAEPKLAGAVRDAMREPVTIIGEPPGLGTLYGLLGEADLLVCNDSGPMHMAAAVGTPVCALYGLQSRETWSPVGEGHRALQPSLPCGASCVLPDACDRVDPMHSYCVRRIGVEEVVRAVDAQLGG